MQYVSNKSELFRSLGVSRQALWGWLKDSTFPKKQGGRYNVDEVRAWMEQNGKVRTQAQEDLKTLHRKFKAEQARKLKLENDEKEGALTKTEELAAEAGPTLTLFKNLLYQKCGEEIPVAMAGVDVPTARIIGLRIAGELLTKMQEAFRKWKV